MLATEAEMYKNNIRFISKTPWYSTKYCNKDVKYCLKQNDFDDIYQLN